MHLHDVLNEIDILKIKIAEYPKQTQGELEKDLEHFMVNYTYNSNAIEGSTLTLAETRIAVIEGLTVDSKPVQDYLDAINHREAFYYIVALAESCADLTAREIKAIHSLVLANHPDDKGIYRKQQVFISGTEYKPPSPLQIPSLIDDLLNNYNVDSRHMIEKAAEFHILFERVHPFIDGNGRTGRLVMNLQLLKEGFQPVDIKFKDRAKYIQALQTYDESNDPSAFTHLVADYQLESLQNVVAILEEKQQVSQHSHTSVSSASACSSI